MYVKETYIGRQNKVLLGLYQSWMRSLGLLCLLSGLVFRSLDNGNGIIGEKCTL